MDMVLFTKAGLLAAVVKVLVDYALNPVKVKFPNLDTWWVPYVTWVVGGVLSYYAGLNLFPDTFQLPVVGTVLTAALVGGGSNLLNDLANIVVSLNGLVQGLRKT